MKIIGVFLRFSDGRILPVNDPKSVLGKAGILLPTYRDEIRIDPNTEPWPEGWTVEYDSAGNSTLIIRA